MLALAVFVWTGIARANPSNNPGVTPSITQDSDGDKISDQLEYALRAGPQTALVQLQAGTTAEARRGLINRHRLTEIRWIPLVDVLVVYHIAEATLDAVATDEFVIQIVADELVYPSSGGPAGSGDPGLIFAASIPGLDGNADGSRSTYSRDDLVVAVIDSGIDPNHQELDGGKIIGYMDFVTENPTPTDELGHGTAVASVIVGDHVGTGYEAGGVTPGAAIVPVKVIGGTGFGRTSDALAGIDWVVANRDVYSIDVVNMSIGVPAGTSAGSLLSDAATRAVDAKLVVVVSSGNRGPSSGTVTAPAVAPAVLTVGATSGGLLPVLSDYSSRGAVAPETLKPEVVAPGEVDAAVRGTSNGRSRRIGTSFAAPLVSGVALAMLQANPGLSPAQVKEAIIASAEDYGELGEDREYGVGVLDAVGALRNIGVAIPPGYRRPDHNRFSRVAIESRFLVNVAAATDIAVGFQSALPMPEDVFQIDVRDPDGSIAPGHTVNITQFPNGAPPRSGRLYINNDVPGRTEGGTYEIIVRQTAGSGMTPWALDVIFEVGAAPAVLRITSITRLTSGEIVLEGIGVPGASHSIFAASTLNLDDFMLIGSATADASGVWSYPDAVGPTTRFYRATFP